MVNWVIYSADLTRPNLIIVRKKHWEDPEGSGGEGGGKGDRDGEYM